MARILINTFGSFGDLHPYFAIGLELTRRGHHVTIATSPVYREKTLAEGLNFLAVRPELPVDDPDFIRQIFEPRRGSERVIRYIAGPVRQTYADLLPAARKADLIVTHLMSFAAVALAQQLRKPWVSTVLAPFSFCSVIDPPVFANAPWLVHLRALGPRPMKWALNLGRRVSRAWLQPVFVLRRELGLPGEHPLFEGQHSPLMTLGLFSNSMAVPQTDWPTPNLITGFPFFDRHHEQPDLDPQVEEFFAAGPAPVVFTLGSSAVSVAGDFYRESLQAVDRMGVRALLLTGPGAQDLPSPLPPGVLAVNYAPHSTVFPRASVIVHQGGVGTTGQAMRSGRPALIVPFAHDQFDNAARLQRLGVADVLPRGRYNARRAQTKLSALLADRAIEETSRRVGVDVSAEQGAVNAADAMESALIRSAAR